MKWIKYLVIAVVAIGIITMTCTWIYINHILPDQLALSIVSEGEAGIESPAPVEFLIPETIKQQVKTGRKLVKTKMQVLDKELERLDISYDDIEIIINDVDPNDVIETIEILNKTELTSVDQLFDIAKDNIHVDHLDVEVFRDSFRKNVKMETIHKVLKKIEQNDLIATISIPVAKQTALQVLKERREKVSRELEKINIQQ